MSGIKMVASFPGNNKNSNLIEGAKTMENFLNNNENGSSIFQGKIREQDFSTEQKLNELKASMEELIKQDLLRKAECERQASNCIDEISSQAELRTEGDDEDYFNCEKPLEDFWSFLEPLFNFFEVDVDQEEVYQMIKEKKEKNLIAAIIEFLRDKLKELIKKIFPRDLSFDQRLDKEIKELQEKLGNGKLSEEEFARVLERLDALQNLKLKLQLAVVGWIVTMFAEMFGVGLAAAVEASTEKEDKKAEKISLEATKEVRKDVEIKVDEREKPKVPVSLFEVLPEFIRPVVLSKPEQNLLPDSLKELMPKEVIKEEIREVKEAKPKVEEEKKVEQPKKEVCPPAPKTAANTTGVRKERNYFQRCDSDWSKMTEQGNNTHQASSQSAKNNKDASDTQGAVLNSQPIPKPVSNKGTSGQFVKGSVTDCGFDFNIGTWNGAENEPKQCFVGGAQEDPRSKVTDVLNERAARGNGNTPPR